MSYLHTLIKSVREDRGLTLQALEIGTHYAASTIHDWEHGRGRIDPDYLARLFQLTTDFRILQFFAPCITGVMRDTCEPASGGGPTPPPLELARANQTALEAIEQLVKSAQYVASIVRDGQVCREDDVAIVEHRAHANRAVEAISALNRSIDYWRDQWQRSNGRGGHNGGHRRET